MNPFVGVWRSERTGVVGPDGQPTSLPFVSFAENKDYFEDNRKLGTYSYSVIQGLTGGITAGVAYRLRLVLDDGTFDFRANLSDHGTRLWFSFMPDQSTTLHGPHNGTYVLVHTLM